MLEPVGAVEGAPGPRQGELAELLEVVVVRTPRGVSRQTVRVRGPGITALRPQGVDEDRFAVPLGREVILPAGTRLLRRPASEGSVHPRVRGRPGGCCPGAPD
eukprot:14677576-Alexandrium_andersonii.AAC.1